MSFPITHGHCRRDPKTGKVKKSMTYQSWSSMNDRCYITTHRYYDGYGGRGIEVCYRWRRGTPGAFANFLDDMGLRPMKSMTLDRWPNLDGNYEKSNCQWATKAQQREHQRRNRPLTTEEREHSPLLAESIEDALVGYFENEGQAA